MDLFRVVQSLIPNEVLENISKASNNVMKDDSFAYLIKDKELISEEAFSKFMIKD